MKKIIVILTVLIFVVSCLGCVGATWLVVRGGGPVVTEERAVSDFTGVNLMTSGNLYIEQGEQESLRIEAEQNVLPYLAAEVSGHTLEIKNRPNVLTFHTQPVNFYLTVKKLDTIILSGSGDIKAPLLLGEQTTIKVSGSGDVDLGKLEANRVEVVISGSGKVAIGGGQVEQQQVVISGSGNYQAPTLTSATADVHVSGSGSAALRAREQLAVNVSGSGDVRYAGRPTIKQHITGSGSIEPMTGS